MKIVLQAVVVTLMATCLSCNPASTTSSSQPSEKASSSQKPFVLPKGPTGTKVVAGKAFQLYIPDDWNVKQRDDSPYHFLEGDWNIEKAKEAGVVGGLTVSRTPTKGQSLQKLGKNIIGRGKFLEGATVTHSETEKLTLADETEAFYVLVEISTDESETRDVAHHLLASDPSNPNDYWSVVMRVVGDAENEAITRGSSMEQLIQQCVKTFVPAPPAP